MKILKINWKQKLTSRKLWTAVVGIVVGLAAAFGLQENEWAQIAGIVTSAASVVAYIFGEAKADAARIETEGIQKIIEEAEKDEQQDDIDGG